MMTLQNYIDELNNMADDYKKMEIKIQAPNGLMFDPMVKFSYKTGSTYTNNDIEYLVVAHD